MWIHEVNMKWISNIQSKYFLQITKNSSVFLHKVTVIKTKYICIECIQRTLSALLLTEEKLLWFPPLFSHSVLHWTFLDVTLTHTTSFWHRHTKPLHFGIFLVAGVCTVQDIRNVAVTMSNKLDRNWSKTFQQVKKYFKFVLHLF